VPTSQLGWAKIRVLLTWGSNLGKCPHRRAHLRICCVVSCDPVLAVQVERALSHLVPHVIYPEAVYVQVAVVTSVKSKSASRRLPEGNPCQLRRLCGDGMQTPWRRRLTTSCPRSLHTR